MLGTTSCTGVLAGSPLWSTVWKIFSEAEASVPGASNKLGERLIEYAIFLHGLVQQWGAATETKFGRKVA